MPLPLLHSVAGYTIYKSSRPKEPNWKLAASCMVLANVADLDFIPGILVGNPDLFHHSFTHSFTLAVIVGLVAAAAVKVWKKRGFFKTFLISFLAYSTHIILDLLLDANPLPIFWPLTPGQLTARISGFNIQNIHLRGFDNFVCDRFLSLACLKRFTVEMIMTSLAGFCFFIYSEIKKKPVLPLYPFLSEKE